MPGSEAVGADALAAAEDVRDVSRLIDENEGRVPRSEERGGRAIRGKRRGAG